MQLIFYNGSVTISFPPALFASITMDYYQPGVNRNGLEDARLSLCVAAPLKQATDWKSIARKKLGFDPDRCPFCGNGNMVMIEKLAPERGPPQSIFNRIKGNGF